MPASAGAARTARPPTAAPGRETPQRQRAAAERRAPQRQPASEPFQVRCFHYGRVFVASAEDAWPRRRFLLDTAHAMNGFAVAERKNITFAWPPPGAAADGAERAFRAFFRHQTQDKRALIAGARVAKLLGQPARPNPTLFDGHIQLPSQAPDAAAKQALWRLLQEL